MKGHIVLAIYLMSGGAWSQEANTPGAMQQRSNFPTDIVEIRENQLLLGRRENVRINVRDDGLTSLSVLIGVPEEFRDVEVANESDLINMLSDIYPYYGFTGTESLELSGKRRDGDATFYTFVQKINHIPTAYALSVEVSNRSSRISSLIGTLRIDREFPPAHAFTEQDAFEKVRSYLALTGRTFNARESPSAALYYDSWGTEGGLAPWWRVKMYGNSYFVAPSGEVDESSGVTEKQ